MDKVKILIIQILISILIVSGLYSQNTETITDSTNMYNLDLHKSKDIRLVNDKYVYFHIVKKKQTLYSIAKLYNIDINTIVRYNNLTSEGISIGQTLLIPVNDENITEVNQSGTKIISGHDTINYHYIKIKPKETLYNLSKTYNVSINDIKKANDGLTEGLKINSIIRIPKNELNANIVINDVSQASIPNTLESNATSESTSTISNNFNNKIKDKQKDLSVVSDTIIVSDTIVQFINHKVQKNETLASIAKKYSVSTDDILTHNPFAFRGIKRRQELRIPVQTVTERLVIVDKPVQISDSVIAKVLDDNVLENENINKPKKIYDAAKLPVVKEKKRFKVALLIPLYLDENSKMQISYEDGNIISGSDKPFRFISFYNGVLMAIDKLVEEGMNIDFYVYDVDEKTSSSMKLASSDVLKDKDLIIGPFFKSSFQIICNYAEMYDIPIVNPTTENLFSGCGYEKSFKVRVNESYQMDNIFSYAEISYPNTNFIIYSPVSISSENIHNKNKLNSLLSANSTSYLNNNYHEISNNSYYNVLRNAQENFIVSFAETVPQIVEQVSQLYKVSSNYNIHLFGDKKWINKDLDFSYFNNIDFHICTSNLIVNTDPEVKLFFYNYQEKHISEPDEFAFLGYDTFYYFLKMLYNFGSDMCSFTPYVYYQGLGNTFLFKYNHNEIYGYENIGCQIYKLENYSFEKLEFNSFYKDRNIININNL